MYVQGIEIPMVDALSIVSAQKNVEIKGLDVIIHKLTLYLPDSM